MDNLAHSGDQKGEKYIIDYSDFSIGKSYIDNRFLTLQRFNDINEIFDDSEYKFILKRQLIESIENFPFKKKLLTRGIILSKTLDEMVNVFSEILQNKFRERELNGDNVGKDIVRMVEEIFINRIIAYLTTNFIEIQKNLQYTIMQKTRGDEKDNYSSMEKKKIQDMLFKLNEYKNGLIDSKRNQIMIKLFGIERASLIYPKINFGNYSPKENIKVKKIGFLAKFRKIINNN